MEFVGGTCGWRYGTLAYKAPLLKQKISGVDRTKQRHSLRTRTTRPSQGHDAPPQRGRAAP
jgi:hypothetical protein